MNPTAGRNKLVLLTALGTLLTLVFVFLGAPFLRLLRNVYGARTYWLIGGALFVILNVVTVALIPFTFLLGSLWLVVGIYSEFEVRGRANFWTAALALAVSSSFLVGGTFYSMKAVGVDIRQELMTNIDSVLLQLKDPNDSSAEPSTLISGMKVDSKFMVSQIPSVMVIALMISLAYGLMMERRLGLFLRLPYERVASELNLMEFRTPDVLVWLAMLSFLGSFVKLQNESLALLAMNVFNVMLAVYFFQGLAITEAILQTFRFGPILRFVVYFVFVFQLFFVLSAVGFIDYWVDFRRRLRNLREKRRKQNNGEHV